jgi:antitoxin MazE
MRVAKWGKSIAVRLPQSVVRALGLHEGDPVEITIVRARSIVVAKVPSNRELLMRLRKYRGLIPEGCKLDRLEANERVLIRISAALHSRQSVGLTDRRAA